MTSDRECVKNCKVVVLATPSFAVRTTARAVASLLETSAVLVSVSKGIEKDTSLTLTDAIAQEVGEGHPIVALSGPSHAEEVGRHVPTGVVAASEDLELARQVQDLRGQNAGGWALYRYGSLFGAGAPEQAAAEWAALRALTGKEG